MMEILALAGTALGAVSSIQQGNALAASQRAQATTTDYQSTILRQNATAAMAESGAREDALQRRQGLQLGRQAAAAGQSGFLASEGSLAGVQEQSSVEAELNLLNENYAGQMAARGMTNQAQLNDFEAARMRANARAARTSGYLSASGQILGGAARYGMSPKGTGYQATGDIFGSSYGMYNR